MITIAATNHSSLLSDKEVASICRALSVQGTHHISPMWATDRVSVQPRSRRAEDWALAFLEDADQAGALGYHDDQDNGLPILKVFVKDCKEAGVSASACASHEMAEALVDAYLRRAEFDGRSKFWATEIGDPLQAFTYEVDGVELQDFATPGWFDPEPPAGAKLSYTGAIKRPFEVPQGGYGQYLDLSSPSSGWQEIGMELGAGHARPARRRAAAALAPETRGGRLTVRSVREAHHAEGGHLYELEPNRYDGPWSLAPGTELEVVR